MRPLFKWMELFKYRSLLFFPHFFFFFPLNLHEIDWNSWTNWDDGEWEQEKVINVFHVFRSGLHNINAFGSIELVHFQFPLSKICWNNFIQRIRAAGIDYFAMQNNGVSIDDIFFTFELKP